MTYTVCSNLSISSWWRSWWRRQWWWWWWWWWSKTLCIEKRTPLVVFEAQSGYRDFRSPIIAHRHVLGRSVVNEHGLVFLPRNAHSYAHTARFVVWPNSIISMDEHHILMIKYEWKSEHFRKYHHRLDGSMWKEKNQLIKQPNDMWLPFVRMYGNMTNRKNTHKYLNKIYV